MRPGDKSPEVLRLKGLNFHESNLNLLRTKGITLIVSLRFHFVEFILLSSCHDKEQSLSSKVLNYFPSGIIKNRDRDPGPFFFILTFRDSKIFIPGINVKVLWPVAEMSENRDRFRFIYKNIFLLLILITIC